MVFAHLPAHLFLILAAFMPSAGRSIRIAYDLLLLVQFRSHVPAEDA
jgi:hypothetical protein